jgi:hypothetical protein
MLSGFRMTNRWTTCAHQAPSRPLVLSSRRSADAEGPHIRIRGTQAITALPPPVDARSFTVRAVQDDTCEELLRDRLRMTSGGDETTISQFVVGHVHAERENGDESEI